MSIKLIRAVLDSALPGPLKLLALALAWRAQDDGSDVFPSVKRSAWDTGREKGEDGGRRSVQRALRALEGQRILERESDAKGGRHRVVRYRFRAENLPARPPFEADRKGDTQAAVSVQGRATPGTERAAFRARKGGVQTARSVSRSVSEKAYVRTDQGQETESTATIVLDAFEQLWAAKHGTKYRRLFSDAVKAAAIQPEELPAVRRALALYFSDSADPYYREKGHPFALFVSQRDRLIEQADAADAIDARDRRREQESEKFLKEFHEAKARVLRERAGHD